MYLILVFLMAPLFGQLEKAELLYDAKQYPQAKEELTLLLEEDLTPWQRSVVTYDLATTLLAMGKNEEADNLLSTIPTEHAPLLNTYVKTNTAVALLRKAEEQNTVLAFREALEAIQDAEKASCQLQQMEGEKVCKARIDLAKMAATSKKQLTYLLDKRKEKLLATPSLEEGIPQLKRSVRYALSHLNFLQKEKLNNDQDTRYRKLFSEEESSWIPLWEAVERIAKTPLKEPYEKAIAFMEKGNDPKSEAALKQALAALDALMPEVKEPIQEQYEYVLSQKVLYLGLIQDIQDEKNEKLLAKSLEAVEEGNTPLARAYLLEALQNTKRTDAPKTPKETLEAAIEEQKHALQLNRFHGEPTLLLAAQKKVIEIADPFLKQVYKEQTESNACQCSPWDEVLPLYHKGFEKANFAQKLLKTDDLSANSFQALAVHDWQQALKKLEAPKKKEKKETNKTAEELQQMQSQDKQPASPRPIQISPGEKPW